MSKNHYGCAAGLDGITAERIKFAQKTKILSHICVILSLCIKLVIVPDSFTQGLLIPILKNYRPIISSTTFSKLLKMHILQESDEHEFHDLQFGFIGNRGISMAAASHMMCWTITKAMGLQYFYVLLMLRQHLTAFHTQLCL